VISGRRYALSSMTAATRLRLGVAVSGFLALIAVYGPVHIPCLFSTATGIQCPACGITRSVSAIARGDLSMSMAYHPMGILLAGSALAAILIPTQTLRVQAAISASWATLSPMARVGIGTGALMLAWIWNLNRVIPL
jgi:Protein of unknown function (DUF2752)